MAKPSHTITLEVCADNGDMVYLVTDPHQLPWIVVAVIAMPGGLVRYELSQGDKSSLVYAFEISTEVDVKAL